MMRRTLRGVFAAVIGIMLIVGTGSIAAAEPPGNIGTDGDLRYVRHWSTAYSDPATDESFSAPTNLAFGPDGSIYAISSYSSGGSPLVQKYDPETGDFLATFRITVGGATPSALIPTGILTQPNGSVWVIAPDSLAGGAVIVQFDALGTERRRISVPNVDDPMGLVEDSQGRFVTVNGESGNARIVTINPDTESIGDVGIPDETVVHAPFQLNITDDDRLIWSNGDALISSGVDGSNVQTHTPRNDLPVFMAALGTNDDLYIVGYTGEIRRVPLSNLSDPGTTIATPDGPNYNPLNALYSLGIAAGPDGTVYSLGYFDDTTPAEPTFVTGLAALRSIHSPTVPPNNSHQATLCTTVDTLPLATQGTPEVSWFEITQGSLPAGLTLNSTTGAITGTPTTAGTTTVAVTARNGVAPTETSAGTDTTQITLAITPATFTATTTTAQHTALTRGSTLRVDTSGWAPRPQAFTYQWLRDAIPIDSATQATYQISDADLGTTLSVTVTANDSCFAATTATSSPVEIPRAQPPATSPPTSQPPNNPTQAPPSPRSDELADTGTDTAPVALVGAALTALGFFVLLFTARRRRTARR